MTKKRSQQHCENCVYWTCRDRAGLGECVRYAPRPTTLGEVGMLTRPDAQFVIWPVTGKSSVCGDWKERE